MNWFEANNFLISSDFERQSILQLWFEANNFLFVNWSKQFSKFNKMDVVYTLGFIYFAHDSM